MISDHVDKERVVNWALELASIYSPTGRESEVATYIHGECRKLGLDSQLQLISPGRYNVIARLGGSSEGLDLMFNGHIDTFRALNEDLQHPVGPSGMPSPRRIDNNWLFGHEIANMKSAIAAYLGAIDAVLRSDTRLSGGIILSGVAGTDPTSSWTKGDPIPLSEQLAVGTKYMLDHSVTADMCVLGEPTSLELIPAHTGRMRFRLSMSSTFYLAPFERLSQVMAAVQAWAHTYAERHAYKGIFPGAHVPATRCYSDFPRGRCEIYLEVRTVPRQRSMDVMQELRELIQRTQQAGGSDIKLELLLNEPASELNDDEPVITSLRKAHRCVTSTLPETTYVGWGADATRLNRAGIPTVIYGPGTLPGRISYPGSSVTESSHYQNITDLITATCVYATLAEDVCGRKHL